MFSAVSRKPSAGETVASRVAQLAVVDVVISIIALKRKSQLRGGSERIEKALVKKRVSRSRARVLAPEANRNGSPTSK